MLAKLISTYWGVKQVLPLAESGASSLLTGRSCCVHLKGRALSWWKEHVTLTATVSAT